MRAALSFRGVTKRYAKTGTPALDSFTAEFPRGVVAGVVGPNGAGKTTAFSIVGGYLLPDAGTVDILGGGDFEPARLKGRLALLPQDAELGPRHSPLEVLIHLGRLQGLTAKEATKEADRVLDLVSLAARRSVRIATLSHGMRRRVAVATALIGDPELVLLDEPFAGLDPRQAQQLRDALLRRSGGRTLIVSSHNLAELERLCEWVVMMDSGGCAHQGSVAEVTGSGQVVVWTLGSGEVPLALLGERLPEHHFEISGAKLTHRAPPTSDLDEASLVVAAALVEADVPIREVRRGVGLERRFFETSG